MKSLIRSVVALSLATVLAACSTAPLDEDKGAEVQARSESGSGAGGAESAGLAGRSASASETGSSRTDPLSDPASPLAKRSIYFDFDSFVIKDEYRSLLEAHGAYLLANPSRRIVI